MPDDDEYVQVFCPQCNSFRKLLFSSVVHNPQQYQQGNRYVSRCGTCARRRKGTKYITDSPGQDGKQRSRKRPSKPTTAEPGSPEKIRVMELRYENDEELYHPDDANFLVVSSRTLAWMQAVAEEILWEFERRPAALADKGNEPMEDVDHGDNC